MTTPTYAGDWTEWDRLAPTPAKPGPTLRDLYHAGLVARWHTYPKPIKDNVAAHSGRVAKLLLFLWPDTSRDALAYALCHDDGEAATGDVPAHVKDANPELRAMLDQIEREHIAWLWGDDRASLTVTELKRVDLCDKLDAYMTAEHQQPEEMRRPEWRRARKKLISKASALGKLAKVERVI